MKVQLAESVTAFTTDSPLRHSPCYALRDQSLAVGGYANQEERDAQLAHTFGSQQWLWSEEDDFRFRNSDHQLESLYLLIPEEPCPAPDACARWVRTTMVVGGLRVARRDNFALETTTGRWFDQEARHMICLRDQAPPPEEGGTRVRIAPDTDLLLAGGKMVGWMLTNPARYLTQGWDRPADTPPVPGTSQLLAAYLAMTSWPALEKILDGDAGACRELRNLKQRILSQPTDPSRTSVLGRAVGMLIEDHC
ncbi:hypothetical protein OG301_15595 [Streptomyces platensis]|uniref:hypothetical protein n=1 Tax=Streptomyces platensis TaxID=58346 RepID=UPI002ED19EB9|nr:hypothetical protein OG301_15595 [Streptomyces platensis]